MHVRLEDRRKNPSPLNDQTFTPPVVYIPMDGLSDRRRWARMIGIHPSTKKWFFRALLYTYSLFWATILFSLIVNKLANLVPNTFGPLPLLISYIEWKGKSVLPLPLPLPTQPKDGSISNERGGREKKKQIWPKGQKDPDHRPPPLLPYFGWRGSC